MTSPRAVPETRSESCEGLSHDMSNGMPYIPRPFKCKSEKTQIFRSLLDLWFSDVLFPRDAVFSVGSIRESGDL